MENAAKALQIAAGILISLLVISALVYGYTQLSNLKQIEEDNEGIEKAAEFNMAYEVYNRSGVYGSELLSLANKIEDYNIKQAQEQGYQEVTLSVTLTPPINAQVYTSTTYDANSLTECYNKLSSKIRTANETVKGKSIAYWSGSSSELRRTFNDTTSPTLEQITEKIRQYNALVSERDDISRLTFKCTNVEYDDNNARIISMKFQEE